MSDQTIYIARYRCPVCQYGHKAAVEGVAEEGVHRPPQRTHFDCPNCRKATYHVRLRHISLEDALNSGGLRSEDDVDDLAGPEDVVEEVREEVVYGD